MSQVRDLRGLTPEQEIPLMNEYQLVCRKQTLEECFAECNRSGKGINTKQAALYRQVIHRLQFSYGHALSDLAPVV